MREKSPESFIFFLLYLSLSLSQRRLASRIFPTQSADRRLLRLSKGEAVAGREGAREVRAASPSFSAISNAV